MYYPCSENKGADQLRGYREADLRLCFRIGKNPVFSRCGSYGLVWSLVNILCEPDVVCFADRVMPHMTFMCRRNVNSHVDNK